MIRKITFATGIFSIPEFQELHNQLVQEGKGSYDDAIRVGLRIEDMDIADLEEALAEKIRNEEIVAVYNKLIMGSENHMRAFWRHASVNSIEWEPEHISKERLEEIIGEE